MKKEWSSEWVSSKQPRKQRKYRYNAPLHISRRFLSATLSKELRVRTGKRSVSLRKGDEVEVMRGSFTGQKGKIDRVELKNQKVYIEGLKVKKVDGSEVQKAIHPSNLRITSLYLEDKERRKIFHRTGKKINLPEKVEPKPEIKAAETKPVKMAVGKPKKEEVK